MAQAEDPAAYIHEGFWRNLGKDNLHSTTLTLRPTNATILTNALALFVAMSGGQLWTIIRFSLHQVRASSKSETLDMTHNQQQIVLRNATTDIATARLMLNLAWASRENAKRAAVACLTIVILAILNAAFFMAAGTFSNSLADAGTEVLSRSPHCGLWNETYYNAAGYGPNPDSALDFALSVEFYAKSMRDVQQSLEYANTCYMSQAPGHSTSSCDSFKTSRLNWTTLSNASCPFGAEICSDVSQTIVLDTGLINTYSDLGINAQIRDRLGYRRVTTCTALNDTGHTTDWVSQDDGSSRAYANYGPSLLEETEFTYSYSNFAEYFTNFTGVSTIPYQLSSQHAYGLTSPNFTASYSTFEPIAALMTSDSDLSLIFLSYTGKYTGPVADPWFSANKVSFRDTAYPLINTNYARDKPVSTLACIEQHQICVSEGTCTPLLGADQVQESIDANFEITPNQNVTLDRLMRANYISSMWYIVGNLATSSTPLLAMNVSITGSSTLSLPLPDYQWQLEVGYWHSTAMAQLQRILVEWGTGEISPQIKYLVPGTGPNAWFCQNIMIKSTVFSSFNVVALAVLITIGTLIILLSLTIERVSCWLQQKWNRGAYGRQMWLDHDMLGFQLKRRRGQSLPSPNGSMPVGQQHIFDRGVQMGIMSPAASRYYPSGLPNSSSPTRASSKALSPADHARHFPSPPLRSNPSSVRSAFTADFVFDFGPQVDAKSESSNKINRDAGKPLPEVPEGRKEFCIDRGTTDAQSDISGSVDCTDKPVDRAPPDEQRPPARYQSEAQDHIQRRPSQGPGRWAYYSAHKRRYGPKLTVPTRHIAVPTPHLAMSSPAGLRGHFVDTNQGNWI